MAIRHKAFLRAAAHRCDKEISNNRSSGDIGDLRDRFALCLKGNGLDRIIRLGEYRNFCKFRSDLQEAVLFRKMPNINDFVVIAALALSAMSAAPLLHRIIANERIYVAQNIQGSLDKVFHCFSADDVLHYEPVRNEFGPLRLSSLIRFVECC